MGYDRGCVMGMLNNDMFKKYNSKIDPADLYIEENDDSYGLEDEFHTTILYGLMPGIQPSTVYDILKIRYMYRIPILVTKIDAFENEKYNVLKMHVESFELHDLHHQLKMLPNDNKYPVYKPHITLAYLNKNVDWRKYADNIVPFVAYINYITYSGVFANDDNPSIYDKNMKWTWKLKEKKKIFA